MADDGGAGRIYDREATDVMINAGDGGVAFGRHVCKPGLPGKMVPCQCEGMS